jgi:hypothetical protein
MLMNCTFTGELQLRHHALWHASTDSFEGPSAINFYPEDGNRERERERERERVAPKHCCICTKLHGVATEDCDFSNTYFLYHTKHVSLLHELFQLF